MKGISNRGDLKKIEFVTAKIITYGKFMILNLNSLYTNVTNVYIQTYICLLTLLAWDLFKSLSKKKSN